MYEKACRICATWCIVAIIAFVSAADSVFASDELYIVDLTDIVAIGIPYPCEQNGNVYFQGTSSSYDKQLYTLSLDTREIIWSLDITDNSSHPVIDNNGNIRYYVRYFIPYNADSLEIQTISPSGEFIESTDNKFYSPKREITDDGSIRWTNVEYGYEVPSFYSPLPIGAGGIAIDNKNGIDLFGNIQFTFNVPPCCRPVIDRDGIIYFHTGSNLFAFSPHGELMWQDAAHLRDTDALYFGEMVIGSDGSLYVTTRNNHIYRYATDSSTGMPGTVLDTYECNPEYISAVGAFLMIAQDSLLCCFLDTRTPEKERKLILEVFTIPSEGYQQDAYWPCYGHDNRRSFATIAPAFYPVSGTAYSENIPLQHAIIYETTTDSTWTTDEQGQFATSLPFGRYTFQLSGTMEEQTITVDDAPVSDIALAVISAYPMRWMRYPSLTDNQIVPLGSSSIAIDHNGNIIIGYGWNTISYHARVGDISSYSSDGSCNWYTGVGHLRTPPVIDESNNMYFFPPHTFRIFAFINLKRTAESDFVRIFTCRKQIRPQSALTAPCISMMTISALWD